MKTRHLLPLLLLPLAFSPSPSLAAVTVTNFIQPVAVYTTAGDLLSNTFAGMQAAYRSGQPSVYRFDILTQWDGLPPDQSFGDMAFNITTTPGLSRVPAHVGQIFPNYRANNPPTGLFDASTTNLNYFDPNADRGTDLTDLQGIVVSVDNSSIGNTYDADGNPQPDPRLNLARSSQFRLGSIDFLFDGHTDFDIYLTGAQFAPLNDITRQFQSTINLVYGSGFFSSFVAFEPEPTTLALPALASLFLPRPGRRTPTRPHQETR